MGCHRPTCVCSSASTEHAVALTTPALPGWLVVVEFLLAGVFCSAVGFRPHAEAAPAIVYFLTVVDMSGIAATCRVISKAEGTASVNCWCQNSALHWYQRESV